MWFLLFSYAVICAYAFLFVLVNHVKCVYGGFYEHGEDFNYPFSGHPTSIKFLYVAELCANPVKLKEALSLLTDGPC